MPKLGKTAPKFHPKTLKFSSFADVNALPTPSQKVYREYKTPVAAKQMFGNDQYGDCVWAMLCNFIILTTSHTGSAFIPTSVDALKGYSDVTGFDPVTGANDNGTAMTDAFAYMLTTGIAGHKILGWAQIDHTNLIHRKLATDMFGATCTGVQLPADAQDQFGAGQPWEVTGSPSEGGHAILHPGYGSLGDDYVSWAKWDQKASEAWSSDNIDEEYALITEDWINAVTKKTPGGLDLAALQTVLKTIAA
jgi:hypothetical protein